MEISAEKTKLLDKHRQWHRHRDQSKWTEAWDSHKLQVPRLTYNWWGFQARDTLQDSSDNSSMTWFKPAWNDRSISLSFKIVWCAPLSQSSIFLYACESWTLKAELQTRICGRIAFSTLFSFGRGKFCNPMRHRGRLRLTEEQWQFCIAPSASFF